MILRMILNYIDSEIPLWDNYPTRKKETFRGKSMQLGDMSIGEKARIIGYTPCQSMCRSKLLVMGLTPGTEVQVTGIAPLGDPIKIHSRGSVICLRKKEAQILKLEKIC